MPDVIPVAHYRGVPAVRAVRGAPFAVMHVACVDMMQPGLQGDAPGTGERGGGAWPESRAFSSPGERR
jgi:hypothetical protein